MTDDNVIGTVRCSTCGAEAEIKLIPLNISAQAQRVANENIRTMTESFKAMVESSYDVIDKKRVRDTIIKVRAVWAKDGEKIGLADQILDELGMDL